MTTTTPAAASTTSTSSSSSSSTWACSDRRWYIHLASTGITFFGGLLLILLARLAGFLLRRLRRRRRGGDDGKEAPLQVAKGDGTDNNNSKERPGGRAGTGDRIDWTSEVKEWANELISAQSITGRILVVLIFILSICSLGIYIYEATYHVGFVENCVPWAQNVMNQVDLAFNIVFLIYFCIRFLAAQDKLWFWLVIYSVVDFFTVPPAFVNIYLNRSWLGLRFLRGLRILTLPDVLQYLSVLKSGTVIRFFQMVTIFISVWVTGAGVTHLFENSGDPQYDYVNANEITFGNCMYFTIVTMSTVGFGDMSPKTDWGKFFIAIYIMFALGIFASFIPEIAEIITSRSPYAGKYKKEHGRRHVIVCGAVSKESIESFLEDFLHEDREDTDVEVVCINKKAPSLEFQSLLKRNFGRLVYFLGTTLNPSDCQRVCLESAAAVIILCNKYAEDPDAEDASNIMRIISIKNVSPKTRCVVQLLQYHNKGYLLNIPNWDWRLGDECLCVAELKQGFLAQSCLAPGFSTLMANLFSTRAMSDAHLMGSWVKDYQDGSAMEIYSEYFSESFVGMTFQEAVMLCYSKLQVILFAIEAKNEEGDRFLSINPQGRSAVIYTGCHGFFIADSQEEVRRAFLYCGRCHRDLPDPRLVRKCSCHAESAPESPGRAAPTEVTRLRGNSANVRRPEIQVSSKKTVLADVQETEFGVDDQQQPQRQRKRQQQQHSESHGDSSKQTVEHFDLTGMFHWCPEKNFEDVMLTPANAARFNLREHYIVIVFADHDSPLIGTRSFVMPLRASNFHLSELKPIVFIGNLEFLQHEWNSLKNFPKIYMFPGSPMSRVILRSAKINLCDMCVIMSAKSKWQDQIDPYLMDKEVVLCTLNIKAMSFADELDTSVQAQMQAFQSKDSKVKSLMSKVAVPILTEIFVGKNIQFLDQDDDDADEEEIYNSQPYACGNAFTTDVLDSLMSTVFYNMNAMTLIRTLVTGGATPEMEILMAEGLSMDGTEATPEIEANRHRCRIMQLSMLDSRLRQFGQATFGDLYTGVLKSQGILCIGIYRYRDSYSMGEAQTTKRVVVTNPPAEFRLLNSDLVYCLVPFL